MIERFGAPVNVRVNTYRGGEFSARLAEDGSRRRLPQSILQTEVMSMQKKVLAAAVSSAMLLVSGAATAQTITNDSLAESGSSLLVGHDGVTIQTDQSFGEVLEALKTAQGLGGYIAALGTGDTLQMPVGGEIYADTQLEELLPTLKQMVPSAAGIWIGLKTRQNSPRPDRACLSVPTLSIGSVTTGMIRYSSA